MGKGIVSGIVWGMIVSAVGLGGASILANRPTGAPPKAASVELPAGTVFNREKTDEEAVLTQVAPAPEGRAAGLPGTPTAAEGKPAADITPPQATQMQTDLSRAALPETAADDDVAEVVTGVAGEGADQTPRPQTSEALATPAQAGPAPTMPKPGAIATSVDAPGDVQPRPADETPPAEIAVPADPAATQLIDGPGSMPAPQQAPQTPASAETAQQEPRAAVTPPPADAVAPPQAPAVPTDATEPKPSEETPDRPAEETPAATPTPQVNRPATTEAAPILRADDRRSAASGGALARNRVPFDNPNDRPLLSILLQHDPQVTLAADSLQQLGAPVSFAVEAELPDASAIAQRYRQMGFEVVVVPYVPKGARPADLEVIVEALRTTVPQAVAVLDPREGGFASQRQLVKHSIALLKDSGHGMIMHPSGFNTAAKLAVQAEVPATTIFRQIDGVGRNAAIMTRALEQGAFKARQEGQAVMLGAAHPDVLAAIKIWALRDRSTSVRLAPISATLEAQLN